QACLAGRPVSPMRAQDRLLLLLRGPVVAVGLSESQVQSLFIAAQDQGTRYKTIVFAYRSEALIIEVIGHTVHAHFFKRLLCGGKLFRPEGTQRDAKPIGSNVLGSVCRPDLAEVTEGHVMMLQIAG